MISKAAMLASQTRHRMKVTSERLLAFRKVVRQQELVKA